MNTLFSVYSRKHEWISFKKYTCGTLEANERWLENALENLEKIKRDWIIVEVEERA